jgi:hypothetical protein
MYELMAGQLNCDAHDPVNGGNLYDSPQRYLHLSPDLHFKGISTVNMIEAGAYCSAVPTLGFGKASRRLGLPTEVIVYPKTFHNVQIPNLQRESAERNLCWFRFWLKDEENPRHLEGRAVQALACDARFTKVEPNGCKKLAI